MFVREAVALGQTRHAQRRAAGDAATGSRCGTTRSTASRGTATYSFLTPRIGANWNIERSLERLRPGDAHRERADVHQRLEPGGSDRPIRRRTSRATIPSKNRYSDPYAKPERLTSFELGAGYVNGATRLKMNALPDAVSRRVRLRGRARQRRRSRSRPTPGNRCTRGSSSRRRGRIPGEVDLSGYVAVSDDVLEEDSVVARRAERSTSSTTRETGSRSSRRTRRGSRRADVRLRPRRAFGPQRRADLPRQQPERAEDPGEPDRPRLRRQADRPVHARRGAGGLRPVARCSPADRRASPSRARATTSSTRTSRSSATRTRSMPTYTSFYSEFFPAAGAQLRRRPGLRLLGVVR